VKGAIVEISLVSIASYVSADLQYSESVQAIAEHAVTANFCWIHHSGLRHPGYWRQRQRYSKQ
jgi:hypothetical protein